MDTSEGMGSGWHIKGVETMATPTSKKNVPRGLILKKNEKGETQQKHHCQV
jgi:hypothetical protein